MEKTYEDREIPKYQARLFGSGEANVKVLLEWICR